MLKDTLSMSERLACKAVGLARSTYRRTPRSAASINPSGRTSITTPLGRGAQEEVRHMFTYGARTAGEPDRERLRRDPDDLGIEVELDQIVTLTP